MINEKTDALRFGFTLAEILITLGIIGVVAAMTIPILRQAYYEHQTVAQLKETYSILSQAIRMAEEEYGEVEGWGITGMDEASALIIAEKLKPFLKLTLDCGTLDTKGACITTKVYKRLNGNNHTSYANNNKYYKLKLLNGSSIWLRGGSESELDCNMVFFVDTNGNSAPNIFGRDLFTFYHDKKHFLKVNGAPDSIEPYTTYCNSKESTGFGCAYYVLNFGNMNYLHK